MEILKNNENAPHKTVIWMTVITYELLPTGECSGVPVEQKKEILQILGQNKTSCLEKTNKFMEDVKCLSN